MLTIILWIPGNWVVVVESRTPFRGSYQIKWSDTSYAGLPEDVAEEHQVIKRIPGKRNQDGHLIVLSLSVQYSLHSHTENILRTSQPLWGLGTVEDQQKPPIEQTPHRRRSWDHSGPQGPLLASPHEQAISTVMGLKVHLCQLIGHVQRDRLMKENEAPNHWVQSHAPDGFRANAGGARIDH
jgi:hypothetical protein